AWRRAPAPARHVNPTHRGPEALARARVSTLVRGIESVEEICHLEGGERGVPAFVSMLAAGACFGLRQRIARENAEANGGLERGAGVGQSARRLPGNIVEVRRIATDHGA